MQRKSHMVLTLLKLVVYLLAHDVVTKVTMQKAASRADLSIGTVGTVHGAIILPGAHENVYNQKEK